MKQVYLMLVTLIMSGCVTGNYQSYSSGVGYQSEQLENNELLVTYTGSQSSQIAKINDFALLRSAELTLENGFNYFVIVEAKNNKVDLGGTQPSLASFRDFGPGSQGPVAAQGTLSSPQAKSELTIVLFHEKPEGISYDARAVEKAVKDEYEIGNST